MTATEDADTAQPGFSKRSIFWVTSEAIGNALLTILVMLVVARNTGAGEFGLAALIVGVVQMVNLFVEGLFHDAIIQQSEVTSKDINSAFWVVQLISSMVLLATVAILAFGIVTPRIGWLSLGGAMFLPFSGLSGILAGLLRKELRFRDVALASMSGRIGGGALGVAAALAGWGAWAIIIQSTCGVMIQALMMVPPTRWRPGWPGDFHHIAPMLKFAAPNALMHSLVALRLQGFSILLASLMGLSAAGMMNVAFRVTTTPFIVLQLALMNFSFPLLSRDKANPEQLLKTFQIVNRIVATAGMPGFVGLALVADEMVPLLLGNSWLGAIPLVRILGVAAALGFFRMSSSFVLRALGRIRYSFLNAGFQAVFVLGGMALLRPSDPAVAVWIWTAAALAQVPLSYIVVKRETGWSIWQQTEGCRGALLAVIAMATGVLALQPYLPQASTVPNDIISLILKTIVGAIIYFLALLLFDSSVRTYFGRFIRRSARS